MYSSMCNEIITSSGSISSQCPVETAHLSYTICKITSGRNNKFRIYVYLDLVIRHRVFRTMVIIIMRIFEIGPVIQIRRIIRMGAVY
jgi:hypothetical protein